MQKKRVIVKIGSNSLTHKMTGHVDYIKIDRLVRELCDLKNRGMDVCLVSSGAIAVGRQSLGIMERPDTVSKKQALASVGQASLMSIYQRAFSEYNQRCSQVLLTKYTFINKVTRVNARNTFDELFDMDVIPIVNENDTISTDEIQFGDNDTLSAIVAALTGADLLILLSDIDGLYTADPKKNKDAVLVKDVKEIDKKLMEMGSGEPGSDVGTGGMATKLKAAKIATKSGADMIIANGEDVAILHHIFEDNFVGTTFHAAHDEHFDMVALLEKGNEND